MNLKINILMIAALLLVGCGTITPISHLALPPVTSIEGSVTQVDKNGFYLKDESGLIFVQAKLPDNKTLSVTPGEDLTVCGNLRGGEEKIFDGYVINKATGEQIFVSRPTPHFGFVLQAAFD